MPADQTKQALADSFLIMFAVYDKMKALHIAGGGSDADWDGVDELFHGLMGQVLGTLCKYAPEEAPKTTTEA